MSVVLLRDKVEGAKEVHLEGMPSLYYVPKYIEAFGYTTELAPSTDDLITEYFIRHEDEYYGYCTGFCSLNMIGGSTQVPMVVEIKSNNVNEKYEYNKNGVRYIVTKSDIEVNSANHFVLELLDDIEYLYDYFEEDLWDVPLVINRCVEKTNLTKKDFEPYLKLYSARTNEVIKHIFTPGWCRLHYIKRRIENRDGRYDGF